MKELIEAVHSAELSQLFDRLGLRMDLEAGRLRCYSCGEVISLQNFGAVTKHEGRLKFACCRPGCLSALAELRRAA